MLLHEGAKQILHFFLNLCNLHDKYHFTVIIDYVL